MQKAQKSDMPEIKKLLEENNLPVADLSNNIGFYIEKENNRLIVVGGLEITEKNALLRSIAVAENFKGQGLGIKMTNHLLKTARTNKLDSVFLLTLTAEKYFRRLGFNKIERESAPEGIKNSTEFTTVCPDSAALMELKIN